MGTADWDQFAQRFGSGIGQGVQGYQGAQMQNNQMAQQDWANKMRIADAMESMRQFNEQFGENRRQYNMTFGENKRQFNTDFGLRSDKFIEDTRQYKDMAPYNKKLVNWQTTPKDFGELFTPWTVRDSPGLNEQLKTDPQLRAQFEKYTAIPGGASTGSGNKYRTATYEKALKFAQETADKQTQRALNDASAYLSRTLTDSEGRSMAIELGIPPDQFGMTVAVMLEQAADPNEFFSRFQEYLGPHGQALSAEHKQILSDYANKYKAARSEMNVGRLFEAYAPMIGEGDPSKYYEYVGQSTDPYSNTDYLGRTPTGYDTVPGQWLGVPYSPNMVGDQSFSPQYHQDTLLGPLGMQRSMPQVSNYNRSNVSGANVFDAGTGGRSWFGPGGGGQQPSLDYQNMSTEELLKLYNGGQ